MGIYAVYTAMTDEQLHALKNAENIIQVLEEIHEADSEDYTSVSIDKMWDGLHFMLTDESASDPLEDDELSEFVVGVEPILSDDEFVAISTQKDVMRIINKISSINFDNYYKAFVPQKYADNKIYPNIWLQDEDKDELFEELKENFELLKNFYLQNKSRNIVVSIY